MYCLCLLWLIGFCTDIRRSKRPDYYSILGVASVASNTEIKSGYKKVALEKHPDRAPPEGKTEAEAAFKLVAEAFEILSDPFMKDLYDQGHDLESIREKVAQEQHKRQRQSHGHGHGHGAGQTGHGHGHGHGH
jgi:DnaJ-class molecular chaperone